MSSELTRANEIIDSYGCQQSNLIAIMQEIQGEYKYLSEEALTLVAEKLGVSTAKVYSVATFYENFSLDAQGRHIVKVCAGTAWPCPQVPADLRRDPRLPGACRKEKDLCRRPFYAGDRGVPGGLRTGARYDH